MAGQKFNKLLIIDFAESLNNVVYWNCVCDCGKRIVAHGGNVRYGLKKSCGCSHKTGETGYKNEFNYFKIHRSTKKLLPKPEVCDNCRLSKKLELTNISGEYKENVNDWKWLCRKCHMISDGRFFNLRQYT